MSDDASFVNQWNATQKQVILEPQHEQKAQDISSPTEFWEKFREFDNLRNPATNFELVSHYETFLSKLELELQNFEAYSIKSLEIFQGKVDVGSLWGLLFIDIHLAVNFDLHDFQTSNRHRSKLEQGALGGLVNKLSKVLLKIERFDSINLPSNKQRRMKITTMEVHKYFYSMLQSVYKCFTGSFRGKTDDSAWRVLGDEEHTLLRQMDENIEHLEAINLQNRLSKPSTERPFWINSASTETLIDLNTGTGQRSEVAKLPYSNLPTRPNPYFLGRNSEIELLRACEIKANDDSSCISVAIHGMGGVGKTQLALYYANSRIKAVDAVFWIRCEKEEIIDLSITEIVLGLKLPGAREGAPIENRALFTNWLRITPAKWIIIFDNANNSKELEACWPASAGFIIITARSPTVGLELGARKLEIQCFPVHVGVQLFLKLVGRDTYSIEEDTAATALIEKLSGHSLAIHQIAALVRLGNHPIEHFLRVYESRQKDIHRRHKQTRPGEYEHFLDTVWLMSFQSAEKRPDAFMLLGILSLLMPDAIPRELFVHDEAFHGSTHLSVLKDELDLAETEEFLLNLAVIRKSPFTSEYSIHRLVQSEFLFYMSEDDKIKRFRDCATLLYHAFPQQINGRLMHAKWNICSKYLPHILSLAKYFRSQPEAFKKSSSTPDLCQLLCSCAWYLSEIGSKHLGNLLDIAYQAYEFCDSTARDPLDFAHLCNTKGVLHLDRGEFILATEFLEKCRSTRERILPSDHEELANIYNNLGNVAFSLRDYSKALKFQIQSRNIRFAEGHETSLNSKAMSCLNTGRAMWRLDRKDEARSMLSNAVDFCKVSQNWYLLAHCHLLLGTFAREDKDYVESSKHYSAAKSLMLDTGKMPSHTTTAAIYYKLGCIQIDQKKFKDSYSYLMLALDILERKPAAKADRARVAFKLHESLKGEGLGPQADQYLKEAQQLRKDLEGEAYHESEENEAIYDNLVCGNFR